jgi:hypothetical protein
VSEIVAPARPAAPATARSVAWFTAPVAGLLSVLAGYVHIAYVSSHWRDWWAYGAFFLVSGVFQALFGLVVMRYPRPLVALAGIAANIGIVGMYFYSRTVGIPLGPHLHVKERVGTVDVATTAGEIVLVAALLLLVGARTRRWTVNALLVVGVVLWVLRLNQGLA